ncbi:esterase-like activity of phytase family protein [Corticibacterium sp. UT-5YL-CI-8]|nr:esterase-like activity of phytase family protein [Tianweitania sp. UT-5YL-CI-8]
MKRSTLACLLAASLLFQVLPAAAEPIAVTARPITQFQIGRDTTRFGPLEFVGGLEFNAPAPAFGSFSAFRFTAPGSDFIGVTDTGYWYFGGIARDAMMHPTGLQNFRMQAMVDAAGKPLGGKLAADAESLAVRDGIAAVGYERNHRVEEYRLQPGAMKGPVSRRDFLIPRRELRQNKGIETLAFAAKDGPLRGALVAVSERSIDRHGNVFAAILDGPQKGVFTIRRDGDFDITDGAFLPDGDLLLLERSYFVVSGVRMRLRRIEADTIRAGSTADGPVLLNTDMSYQIDNMEGLDVWRRDDGALMVSLISDDNGSIFQRNLYLEFILHDG